MNRLVTWKPMLLVGMAVGLVIIASVFAVLGPAIDPVVTSTAVPRDDPQVFAIDEVDAFADCVANEEWPEGEIPTSALIRREDDGPLERVSFETAYAHAEAGTAWYVASCKVEQ